LASNGERCWLGVLKLLDAERRAIPTKPYAFVNVDSPEDLVRANGIALSPTFISQGVAGSNELLRSRLLVV
jgi:hypothetical protein